MSLFRIFSALILAIVITSCSGNSIKPTPLDDSFQPKVDIHNVWFRYLSDKETKSAYQQLEPVVIDGLVYGVASTGAFQVVDLKTGRLKLAGDVGEEVSGGLGTDGNWLFFGTSNGDLVAVDRLFSEQWRVHLSSRLLTQPVVAENRVFASVQDGKLVALDRSTGSQLWQFDSASPRLTVIGNGRPEVHGDQLIVGFDSGKLVGFNPRTGEQLWEYVVAEANGRSDLDRISDVDGRLLFVDNAVVASAANGSTVVVDLASGRKLESFTEASDRGVVAANGLLYLVLKDDVIVAVNPKTHEEVWRQEAFKYRTLGNPVEWNGYLAVVDAKGYLHLLDFNDGSLIGRYQVDFLGVRSTPVVDGEYLLVQGSSDRLKAFLTQDIQH
ncbi:outer membrane protein assembly factor BamB [Gynuella sp.]|uniref:outer membrane protein assembly factor BamB n=1 Tax=Gynuella sp. TaxID=2969146 RepID=UPI003D12E2B6